MFLFGFDDIDGFVGSVLNSIYADVFNVHVHSMDK